MNRYVVYILAAVLGCSAAAKAAEFELRMGHGAAPDNPRHIIAKEFAAAVKERTGGRVEIEVHHSESLGSDSQMAEALMLGRLDLSINSQGPTAAYIEKLNVIGLPFLFSTPEQAYKVLDGEIGAEIAKPLERKNMKVLAYWDNGFRQITNNKRPIAALSDLRDLRIRTPEDKLTIAIFNALGADPTPFAFGKVYEALEQEIFDGQENPLINIYYSKLFEVQKYLSITNHKYECCPLLVSLRTWRLLPQDIQSSIESLAREFAVKHRLMSNRLNVELLGKFVEAGLAVNQVDTQEMREQCSRVYADFEKVFGKDLIERVTSLAK